MAASLRRLFEMALGASVGLLGEESVAVKQVAEGGVMDEGDASGSSMLTKTLGHHVDTPALAPFLGRAPKRRQINVYDEDEDVDTVGEETVDWETSFRSLEDGIPETKSSRRQDGRHTDGGRWRHYVAQRATKCSQNLPAKAGSRFHITARVIVSDWSLHLSDSARF